VSFSSHCTAYSLPIHCLFTAYSLPIHCLCTAYALPMHCLPIHCPIRCLFTIHCLFTAYSLPIHCRFTADSLPNVAIRLSARPSFLLKLIGSQRGSASNMENDDKQPGSEPVCTSCERHYSVSLRSAQWATLPSAREKCNQDWPKTALAAGCFGPVLIEFREQSPHMSLRRVAVSV
jgi:hypothetical protein